MDGIIHSAFVIHRLTAFKHRYDELLVESQKNVQYVLPTLAKSSPAKRVRSPSPDRSPVPQLRSSSLDENESSKKFDSPSTDESERKREKSRIRSSEPSLSPASKSFSKSNKSWNNIPTDIPEIGILLEHQDKLEKHIISLDQQVQFLKKKKKQEESKHQTTVERLVKQLQGLNHLLTKSKDEKDTLQQEMDEKNRNLEVSLVHLATAQEEIKRLIDEKDYHKAMNSNDNQRM